MFSIFDTGPYPPPPPNFNMAEYVLSAGQQTPDKPALEILGDKTRVITYAELRKAVASIAAGLLASGLGPGDRAMLRLGNRVEFPLAYLACIWVGIVPVPTSAQLTKREITSLAEKCTPKVAITQADISTPDNVPILHCDTFDQMQGLDPVAPALGDPDRLAYIIFTSGTSGKPRGVCHAHRAIWARQMMFEGWYGLEPEDRVLHAGAFNWTYTMGTGLMDPWTRGATALIPEDGTDTGSIPSLITNSKATIFAAAPGVYRKILPEMTNKRTDLRHGLSAGEHLSEQVRTDWKAQTDTELHQALGMSECSTFISSSPTNPAQPHTSGRPQSGRTVAILKDGKAVPYDEEGMLAISTNDPGLMKGYLDGPSLTGQWFETGDQAKMAADGTITYLGRNDDMMNAGGFRVSPLEVENSFVQIAGVTACAAVQVSVKKDASVIALYYAGPTEEHTLRTHAEQNLARYKQPRLYIRQAALPYGANGKLNRRALRTSFEAP